MLLIQLFKFRIEIKLLLLVVSSFIEIFLVFGNLIAERLYGSLKLDYDKYMRR